MGSNKGLGLGLMVLVLGRPAVAEPLVLHDAGGTRPLAEYVEVPVLTAAPKTAPHSPVPIQAPGPRFPVRTPGLVPGPVASKAVNLLQWSGRPMFLIGSDSFSLAWLARYRDRLRTAGAVGVLVQADTAQDFQAVQSLAQGLPLTAFDATELARSLGLTAYPVLVSAERIEQ